MAVDDHGLEVIRKSGEEVTPGDKSDYYIKVAVVSGSTSGTEYTDGDIDATPTGSAILYKDEANTMRVPSATDPLPVEIIAGGGGSSLNTGTVDGTISGTQRVFVNNKRQQVLSAHDLVETYTWAGFGTKTERVTSIVYTSATIAGVTITRTFSYTLVGGLYRLDSETWTSSAGG